MDSQRDELHVSKLADDGQRDDDGGEHHCPQRPPGVLGICCVDMLADTRCDLEQSTKECLRLTRDPVKCTHRYNKKLNPSVSF